ncbi:MAG: 50S ribosome-binding GTPase [Balneolaceae bacterium]|nr:50S ribosome-binding GTPase [Balneolaceae bacterium]
MKKVKESSRHMPSEHGLLSQTFRIHQLQKLGVNLDKWDYVVALAGNPNTGKSTVFNSLTGLRQHTGNWPGKTVNRAEGAFSYKDNRYKIVDLPGTYSLLSTSEDEEIARNFILFGQPDVTLIVADATRLERNLNLTLQILEITPNAVLCLNLMDEAKRKGIKINEKALQQRLGIPVITTTARYGDGMEALLYAIEQVATDAWPTQQRFKITVPEKLEESIHALESDLKELYPDLPNTRWIALRLLEGDERVVDALKNDEFSGLMNSFQQPPLDLNAELDVLNTNEASS